MNRFRKFLNQLWEEITFDLKNDAATRVVYAGAPFIVIAILLWKFGHYFEARLGITLAVVEIPIFMFGAFLASRTLREAREEAKEAKMLQDKEKHEEQLVEKIYKKLTSIQVHIIKDKAVLQVERFDNWEPWHSKIEPENLWLSLDKLEYPYFDYALEHLKEYTEIYFHWNDSQNLVDRINKGVKPNELEITKGVIQESLRQFRTELMRLTARLEAGESLKGTCPLGY